MHRRAFLRVLGAAPVFAAVGCAAPPDPTVAWVSPGSSERDIRRYALAHALLAPNPHNRQPWRARLDGEHGLSLFVDRTRLLPVTDPFDRQITIGCGAFLELLTLAAGAKGVRAEVTPFPEGQPGDRLDDRPFASVNFAPDGAVDPLFAQILRRRTNRGPFAKDHPVPPTDLAALTAAVDAEGLRAASAGAGKALADLRRLVEAAYRREVETPAAHGESMALMRIGAKAVSDHRDGISLTGPGVEAMHAVGLLTRAQMIKPGTIAYNQALAFAGPQAETASAFVWIISQGNDRLAQIAAGRAYARLCLTVVERGLEIQPMSQGLQEYPRMAALKRQVDAATGVGPGERLQMLARLGHAQSPDPAPRRGLGALFV